MGKGLAVPAFSFSTKTGDTDGEPISLHRFPLNDQDLLRHWIQSIPREDFVPTSDSRVGSKLFHPGDFKYKSTDSNEFQCLKETRLTNPETATEKIGSTNIVSGSTKLYVQAKSYRERSVQATSASREASEQNHSDDLASKMFEEDQLNSFPNLRANISNLFLPAGPGVGVVATEIMLGTSTAKFMEFVQWWWNVIHSKTPNLEGRIEIAICTRSAISADSESHTYLHWLEEWQMRCQKKGKGLEGLSRETFLLTIHTTKALSDLAKHLLLEERLNYVLPGQFQCDTSERRFRTYGHMGGSNYFVSVPQILEAEKMYSSKIPP